MIWVINNRKSGAFTVVEMLVVISIIVLLAALVVGGMSRAKVLKDRSRVKGDLNMLITAIDSYKNKLGFYPPDNDENPAQPPLFYELTGTVRDEKGDFLALATGEEEKVTVAQIQEAFNVGGFANASTDRDLVFNFAKNIKANQYAELADVSGDVEVLVVPVEGTNMIKGRVMGPDGNKVPRNINPWRYVSKNPTRNPNSFDLWAEVKIGKNNEIIGNW